MDTLSGSCSAKEQQILINKMYINRTSESSNLEESHMPKSEKTGQVEQTLTA